MMKDFKVEKIDTKTGYPTLKVNDYLLHSKYDPVKEAEIFVQKNFKPGFIHILIGNGLGYISNRLASKITDNEKLIVIEPIENIISNKLANNIIFFKGITKEEFSNYFSNNTKSYDQITVLCSPNYEKLLPEYIKEMIALVKQRIQIHQVNENTLNVFSEQWQKNYIYNLKYLLKDHSIETLKDKFEAPVIIASGGPSLTKQLPKLKKIRENVIVIASGSTINTLLSNDITPDYVISIDGGDANYHHFKDGDFSSIKLIYSLYQHYKIREVFKNNAYYFLPIDGMNDVNHLKGILGIEVPILMGGGSVATYALSFATYISKGPIALIGQDLAYTDNKTHAENNKHFTFVNEEYKKRRGMYLTTGYYGDDVLTDNAFYAMKEACEKMIKMLTSERVVYNCTEGGILLKGYTNIPFDEFCDRFLNRFMENKIDFDQTAKDGIVDRDQFVFKMENEIQIYNQINIVLDESLKVLEKNHIFNGFSPKTLKKLDKNDKKLKSLIDQVSMARILEPITLKTLKNFRPKVNETESDKYYRVINQNRSLLEELLKSSVLSQQYTKDLLNQIINEVQTNE